jgi:predicted oxidoreductase (fatty acid repression mutant protein)
VLTEITATVGDIAVWVPVDKLTYLKERERDMPMVEVIVKQAPAAAPSLAARVVSTGVLHPATLVRLWEQVQLVVEAMTVARAPPAPQVYVLYMLTSKVKQCQ